MKLLNNYSLKSLNTFNIDIFTKYFIEINTENELIELSKSGLLNKEKFIILGNGSNILFTNYFDGIVIKNKYIDDYNIEIEKCYDNINFTAPSGIDFEYLIQKYLIYQQKYNIKLFGLENLAAIPTTIGAAVIQNIGAYGIEQKDLFVNCEAINLKTGNKVSFNKKECKFDYRNSKFKQEKHYFITKATFAIPINNKPILDYPDLQKLKTINEKNNLTAKNIYYEIIKIRNLKLPNYENEPNAGSFFKNPMININHFEKLKKIYPTIKSYETTKNIADIYEKSNNIKVSAAWLIENAGLKGYRNGKIGISDKHSLFIINYKDATGQEIVSFAEYIINEVKEKFDIELTPEVEFIY